MLISNCLDSDKNLIDRSVHGIPVDQHLIHAQRGMIYWFIWGAHTFDIRVMRKVLSLQEENPLDRDFGMNRQKRFEMVIRQILDAANGKRFADLIEAHDLDMEETALAEQRKRERAAEERKALNDMSRPKLGVPSFSAWSREQGQCFRMFEESAADCLHACLIKHFDSEVTERDLGDFVGALVDYLGRVQQNILDKVPF